jgi:hypothetical protein
MSQAPPAPDQPLKIASRGLAKVDDLRELLRDLGPRVGVRSGHANQPDKPQVPTKAPSRALQYFQFDKTSGLAKTHELRRIHALLLKAVPAASKTPFAARKYTGVLKRSDVRAFHKHWLAIFKAETQALSS